MAPLGREQAAVDLGTALRRLMDAAVLSTADAEVLQAAASSVEAIAGTLEGPDGDGLDPAMPWPEPERMRRGDRPHNPVIGAANPLAPPMSIHVDDDGSVRSEITMRPIHEGPPGVVHGGWVATLLDQLLGIANAVSGHGGMTAELTIRYVRATPYAVPLTLRARTDSVDGRRITASGEIVANGVVTARATGLFVKPSDAMIAALNEAIDQRG